MPSSFKQKWSNHFWMKNGTFTFRQGDNPILFSKFSSTSKHVVHWPFCFLFYWYLQTFMEMSAQGLWQNAQILWHTFFYFMVFFLYLSITCSWFTFSSPFLYTPFDLPSCLFLKRCLTSIVTLLSCFLIYFRALISARAHANAQNVIHFLLWLSVYQIRPSLKLVRVVKCKVELRNGSAGGAVLFPCRIYHWRVE